MTVSGSIEIPFLRYERTNFLDKTPPPQFPQERFDKDFIEERTVRVKLPPKMQRR